MNDKPLPTEVLANALQNRVHPSSGVLKDQRPVRRYGSRKPGTNPRTGEPLVPWQEVQVLDPELPHLDWCWAEVNVQTDEGSRLQNFRVYTTPGTGDDWAAKIVEQGKAAARTLGFTVVQS